MRRVEMRAKVVDGLPDLRTDPDASPALDRLPNLIESVRYIEDAEPPECFAAYCRLTSCLHRLDCQWERLRGVYRSVERNGIKFAVIVMKREDNGRVGIREGNRRSAVLIALDRPIPFYWEHQLNG